MNKWIASNFACDRAVKSGGKAPCCSGSARRVMRSVVYDGEINLHLNCNVFSCKPDYKTEIK